MHAIYNFDFLDTVSKQLFERLEEIPATVLTEAKLDVLARYQAKNHAKQGVYVLFRENLPCYVGKATDVRARLEQHRRKLSGRTNLTLSQMTYKALLLDKSMSTAANENILMGLFQRHHEGMWNNSGFGPKDPGKERDTTAPSQFDKDFPINTEFPVTGISGAVTISNLFNELKQQLPFVFRYQQLPVTMADKSVNLSGVPRRADALLEAAITRFDPGWRAAILHYGMVIYKNAKSYPHALRVIDSPPG